MRTTDSVIVGGREYSNSALKAIKAALAGKPKALGEAAATAKASFDQARSAKEAADRAYGAAKREHDALIHAAGLQAMGQLETAFADHKGT